MPLKQKISLILIIMLLLINIVVWREFFSVASPHFLKVDVLDIGQGDSIFIETPSMRHILIDGGPDSSVLGKLQRLLPFWQKTLDMVILTHPDQDHIMGLLSILEKYKVHTIVWTGMVRDGGNYQRWQELLVKQKKQGANIVIAEFNKKINNGKIVIDILHPFDDLEGKFIGNEDNDTGIVSRLVYGVNSFLFTADVSSSVEEQMLDQHINLTSDVLKVAHHGSKYSTSEAFLKAVEPKVAVISVGAHNTYGHPTLEVLQRLRNSGISTLRTDRRGDIIMLSDGNNINIK